MPLQEGAQQILCNLPDFGRVGNDGEFDPGSGLTLAACLTHASRTRPQGRVADG